MPRKHAFIPDCQVTPSTPTDHLEWIGHYLLEKQPDVIVQIGDFWDMESLSSYSTKRQAEGRRVLADIQAGNNALKVLDGPIDRYNEKRRQFKERQYKPEKHHTRGNHCVRVLRWLEDNPVMDGVISFDNLNLAEQGWIVHDFLEVVEIDGVNYSHYFCNPMSGRPYGGMSMDTRLKNVGFSFCQGHQQVYLNGTRTLNNGTRHRGLVCGACYLHDELYRGPQSNSEWRGIFILHEVKAGDYSLMEISLDFLCRRYEGVPLWKFMSKKYPDIYEHSAWLQKQERFAHAA